MFGDVESELDLLKVENSRRNGAGHRKLGGNFKLSGCGIIYIVTRVFYSNSNTSFNLHVVITYEYHLF